MKTPVVEENLPRTQPEQEYQIIPAGEEENRQPEEEFQITTAEEEENIQPEKEFQVISLDEENNKQDTVVYNHNDDKESEKPHKKDGKRKPLNCLKTLEVSKNRELFVDYAPKKAGPAKNGSVVTNVNDGCTSHVPRSQIEYSETSKKIIRSGYAASVLNAIFL